MSFYIGLYDKSKAPQKKEELAKWLHQQTDYNVQDGIYDDISIVSNPNLEKAYRELIKVFPTGNGRDALPEEEQFEDFDDWWADYAITDGLVYIQFGSAHGEEANDMVIQLAEKYDLGIFDPYDDTYAVAEESENQSPATATYIPKQPYPLTDPTLYSIRYYDADRMTIIQAVKVSFDNSYKCAYSSLKIWFFHTFAITFLLCLALTICLFIFVLCKYGIEEVTSKWYMFTVPFIFIPLILLYSFWTEFLVPRNDRLQKAKLHK